MRVTHTYVELELSAQAYDEIENKLLGAGYDHVFDHGPGSAIDMTGIAVTRRVSSTQAQQDTVKAEEAKLSGYDKNVP